MADNEMSGARHTPGPWRSLDEGHPFDGIYRVAAADSPMAAGVTWQKDNRAIVAECRKPGNARLIAAAPDLYAALEHARTCVPYPSDAHDKIVAALAKAKP